MQKKRRSAPPAKIQRAALRLKRGAPRPSAPRKIRAGGRALRPATAQTRGAPSAHSHAIREAKRAGAAVAGGRVRRAFPYLCFVLYFAIAKHIKRGAERSDAPCSKSAGLFNLPQSIEKDGGGIISIWVVNDCRAFKI